MNGLFRLPTPLVFLLAVFPALAAAADDAPPNILIITADNIGYGDLPSYRPESANVTPNIDRLAAEGARLTQFYTASPTCTVSRACLLTGRVPQRHGLENQLAGVEGNYGRGLSHDEILIPQVVKASPHGYATACFGKWNVGFAEGSRPTERGFDEFIGHASGNMDYFRHNYRGRHDLYKGTEEWHRPGEYSTDLFADAAIDFIRRNSGRERPWFCYLPFNAPHFPSPGNRIEGEPNVWQAPDWAFEAIGLDPGEESPEKRYAAVLFALDKAIGRVLDALGDEGAAENTFLFFFSDNGAFRLDREGLDVGINEPLREGGVTLWEGGIRVPAFARWPGRIEPGSVIDVPAWSPDLLVASAALAEAPLPRGVTLDGKDPLPLLTEGATSPHESFWFRHRDYEALRSGDWKILRTGPEEAWKLFHLGEDPGESRDLAAERPEKTEELAADYGQWLAAGER